MGGGVETGNAAGSSPARRRRHVAGALAVVLLLTAGLAVAIVLTRSSSPPASGDAGSVAGSATVQRRDLVETDTEPGTLGYADPQTVYDRLSGTITWLPAVGRVINPGQPLYAVNERAVVLFDGALPAYRALTARDSAGQDILQLNRDLVQMGFADDQITVKDTWQPGTTDAVKRWQASIGQSQTGTIALGRIAFLPGAQRVTQLEATCGSTGAGSSSGPSSSGGSSPTNGCGVAEASATRQAWRAEFVDFTHSGTTTPTASLIATTPTITSPGTPTTSATTSPTTTSPAITTPATTTATTTTPATTTATPTTTTATPTTTTTPATPMGTKPPSGHEPSGSGTGAGKAAGSAGGKGSGNGGESGSGSGSAPDTSVIEQTTSTRVVVTVALAASSQSEAVVGSPVTVEMPNGSTVAGTVRAVSSVAQNSSNGNSNSGNSSSATVLVTITLGRRVTGAGLDQAAVSVNFSQARAKNVLSAPVTALIATAGPSYAVQQASPPNRLIPVTTGLFAAGYVQISGAGVHPGLQVTDSQG